MTNTPKVSAVQVKTAVEAVRLIGTKREYLNRRQMRDVRTLITLYSDLLGKTPPQWMGCNTNGQTLVFSKRVAEEKIASQENINRHASPHIDVVNTVTKYCSRILARKKRFSIRFLKPLKADAEYQLFAELKEWAANSLPHLIDDETHIDTLERRINYLDRVCEQRFLNSSKLHDATNDSRATVTRIKLCLESTLKQVKARNKARCAREKLSALNDTVSSAINSLIFSLYHLKEVTNKEHPVLNLQELQTGSVHGHLEAFACWKPFLALAHVQQDERVAIEASAFIKQSEKFFPKYLLENSGLKADAFLALLDRLYHHAFEMKKAKSVIELAIEMAGKAGDVWCYGEEGGIYFRGFLSPLLENGKDLLQQVNALYVAVKSAKEKAVLKKQVKDADNAKELNHRELKKYLQDTVHYLKLQQIKIADVVNGIDEWSEIAEESLVETELKFFDGINQYRQMRKLPPLDGLASKDKLASHEKKATVADRYQTQVALTTAFLAEADNFLTRNVGQSAKGSSWKLLVSWLRPASSVNHAIGQQLIELKQEVMVRPNLWSRHSIDAISQSLINTIAYCKQKEKNYGKR